MVTILLFFVGILHMLRLFLVVIFALFSCSLSVVANAEEEIGHYTMNGVTFAIPKKALLVKVPEGEVDDIIPLLLHWPDMEPAEWKGDQSKVIHVTLMPYKIFNRKIGDKTVVTNTLESYYQTMAHIFVNGKNNQVLGIKAEPYFMAYHATSGLNGYKMPYSGHYNTLRFDFFIEGSDPIHPKYWVLCKLDVSNSRCESYNKINDQIMAVYDFNKFPFFTSIPHEMRAKVTQKIHSFIIN